jgi:hypothetical protein
MELEGRESGEERRAVWCGDKGGFMHPGSAEKGSLCNSRGRSIDGYVRVAVGTK